MTIARALFASVADIAHAVAVTPELADFRITRSAERWLELEYTGPRGRPAIYIVVAFADVCQNGQEFARHVYRAQSGNYPVVVLCSTATDSSEYEDVTSRIAPYADAEFRVAAVPTHAGQLAGELLLVVRSVQQRFATAALELDLERSRHENEMLVAIGRALSQERDPAKLMTIILQRACEAATADAGSIYIVVGAEDSAAGDARRLRFVAAHNDSRAVTPAGFELPVSQASIVGAAVLASETLNIPDLYRLDAPGQGNNPWGFVHDRSFDERYGYQTRSVLVVPMISARNEVIGVLQLINRRAKGWLTLETSADFEHGVVPFDETAVAHVVTLASQAGIALENVRLYDEVRGLFDGFVKAAVTAIEARDPTTSGHSERVATLTVGLARQVNRALEHGAASELARLCDHRPFSADELTELQYAALLHDFGKVGVREHVLTKAKKLYEHERERIADRFRYIRRGHYLGAARRGTDEVGRPTSLERELQTLDEIWAFVLHANEPTVLEQGGFERIAQIAHMHYEDDDGVCHPYLTSSEAAALQITRGSLTDGERDEINRHVTHTFNFLCQIPWGRSLRRVPQIAGAHHEKLDGTGYPHAIPGREIPVGARMMAISDIFDALTAKDRPYKRAMPVPRALDVIAADVKQGKLDKTLFDLFVEARLWHGIA